jgi:hypothetical protein
MSGAGHAGEQEICHWRVVAAPGEGLNLGAACRTTGSGTSLAAAAVAGAALIARPSTATN